MLAGEDDENPVPENSNAQSYLLDLVHTDVCGPMRAESLGRARSFVEFIDDHLK